MKIIKFNYNLFFAFALLSVGCGTSPSEIPPNPYSDWVRENLLGKVRSIELIRMKKTPQFSYPRSLITTALVIKLAVKITMRNKHFA